MTSWATQLGALALGLVISDFLYFNHYFSVVEPARGYLAQVLKVVFPFYLAAVLVRSALGFFLLVPLMALFHSTWLPVSITSEDLVSWKTLVSVVAPISLGALIVFAQFKADLYFIERGTVGKYKSFFRLLLRLNVITRQQFAAEIQRLKEADNFDCENSTNYWDVGVPPDEMRRRLRVLWERHKATIAERTGRPDLAGHQVGVSAQQRFYPLVAYLGREGLRRQLRDLRVGENQWDGRERRRKLGFPADREDLDSKDGPERSYD